MSLAMITPPNAEPVTAAELKLNCRMDADLVADDAMLDALIAAARQACEHETGRALMTQEWSRTLDAFPVGGILLGMPPVTSVVSVTYVAADGSTVVMPGADYVLDTADEQRPYLLPAAGTDWPETYDTANAVRVIFSCGYGASVADVPAALRAWVMLKAASLYTGGDGPDHAAKMAPILAGLLDRWRVYGC